MIKAMTMSLAFAALTMSSAPTFAQGAAVIPGAAGSEPLTRGTGTGVDSPVTGYSEQGRGGVGGVGGGPSTNGTAAAAGTATGGNPSGYPDRN